MTATSGHVFISHGSEDRDEANELSDFIEARGIRTWIAPRDVRPGQDYSEQLQQAIEECGAFVVLVTGKANTSPYVRAETEMAFSTSKPIFPVRQSDIQPAAGLAFFLKIRHWTDAFGKNGDAAMERLGRELDVVCGAAKAVIAPESVAAPEPPAVAPTAPPVAPTTPPVAPTSPPTAAPPPAPAEEPTAPPLFAPLPDAQPTIPPTGAASPLPDAQTIPPSRPVPPPLSAEEEERLTAAIGPNAVTYLEKWRKMEASGTSLSWNWSAFLANIFWLAYRKMWLPLAVGVVLFFLTDFIVGRDRAFLAPGWLFLLLITLLCGAIGNALYRRQVKALVAKADGLDQPVALAQIRAQGGISIPGMVSSLAVFLLLFIAAGVAQINQARNAVPPPVGAPAVAAPAPAEQPAPSQPQPQAEQPQPAVTLDSAYLVGRWSDDGATDCNNVFNADGTFTANDGSRGYWNLSGDRLTLTGNTTVIVQVTANDQNNVSLVNPDGSVSRAVRC